MLNREQEIKPSAQLFLARNASMGCMDKSSLPALAAHALHGALMNSEFKGIPDTLSRMNEMLVLKIRHRLVGPRPIQYRSRCAFYLH